MRLSTRLGALLIVLGVVLSLAPSASAAGPSAAVAPSVGVGDGQWVLVSWQGFPPFGGVAIRQCTAHPVDPLTDCARVYSSPAISNRQGSGKAYVPARAGDVTATNGTATFTCDAATPCTMAVSSSSTDISSAVLIPISFAVTPDACPAPTGSRLLGGGETSAFLAMFAWSAHSCTPPDSLAFGYTGTNSLQGMQNYIAGTTGSQFAITGMPPTQDIDGQLFDTKHAVTFAPVTASSLVLAYKIYTHPGGNVGQQITDLKLSPEAVAKIFTGQITNWNIDPTINRLNPQYKGLLPSIVQAAARADQSAATWTFTSWLNATAKRSLPKEWQGPTAIWPSVPNWAAGITGERNLADLLASGGDSPDWLNWGYIGYVDSSWAKYFGLSIAKIQNPAGAFVDATPATVRAAIAHMHPGRDGILQPDFQTRTPGAYPMPQVDYVMAPCQAVGASGAEMADVIRYAVGDGQQPAPTKDAATGGVLPLGYVGLPGGLVTDALQAAKQIGTGVQKCPHTDYGRKHHQPGTNPAGQDGGTTPGGGPGFPSSGGSSVPPPPSNHPSSTGTKSPPSAEVAVAPFRAIAFTPSSRRLPVSLAMLGLVVILAGPVLRRVSRPGDVSSTTGGLVAKVRASIGRWP